MIRCSRFISTLIYLQQAHALLMLIAWVSLVEMILCQNAIPIITIAIARRGQLVAMVMTQTVEIFIVPQALKEPAATATVIVKGVCLIILYYIICLFHKKRNISFLLLVLFGGRGRDFYYSFSLNQHRRNS